MVQAIPFGFTFDAQLILPLILVSIIPVAALYKLRNYFNSKTIAAKRLKDTGIGRGAPGFLTGSKKVAIPLEIRARMMMGEEVTGEEITAALDKIAQDELDAENQRLEREKRGITNKNIDTDWLPAQASQGKARRRKN